MNRIAGIIVAAIGLIIAILSIAKILPNQTQFGVGMILFGGLVIGLSFIEKPDPEDTPKMSTPSTLINIFFSPGEVFRNMRRHPRWLVAVLVMIIASAIYSNVFTYQVGADKIVNYAIDKTKEMSFLNEEARAQIEKSRPEALEQAKNPINRVTQTISSFMWLVVWISVLSSIFLLIALAMGGKLNFWQSFSATAYALFPASIINSVLSLIILFIKDTDQIHPILGQGTLVQDNLNFLVLPASSPLLYTVLSAFGVLAFYRIWMFAIGLRDAGENVSSTTGWSAAIGLWVLGLILGIIASLLFPSFLS